jgi:hypothetical protein
MRRIPRPESAKIIAFPLKNRVSGVRTAEPAPAGAAPKRPVEWGSSWYHQAAIDEASRERKP